MQIKKAKKDRVIAGKEAAVKQAELGAQQVTLERHAMRARFAGEVQQLFKHQAEWARPGDPILRLVQFDVLYADVLVNSREHAPGELRGKPATLTVQQASGNQAVEGRITYVDQTVIEASEGGAFLVRAEIQNRQENGSWIVRPGLTAKLTIHVDQPAVVK